LRTISRSMLLLQSLLTHGLLRRFSHVVKVSLR